MARATEPHRDDPTTAATAAPRALTLLAAAVLTALCTGPVLAEPLAAACTKTYSPQTLDVAEPLNLGQLKLQLYFYACSGAYDADVSRVVTQAQAHIERRAGEVTNPALVLDIDETSLSNLPEILANDFGFIVQGACDRLPEGPCGWSDWIGKPNAKAIDATLTLFNAARARNVAVFFVSGRKLVSDNDQAGDALFRATVENLTKAGYSGWNDIILRPPSASKMSVTDFKSRARAKIAERYSIVANIGDQRSDLDGGYAERAYKLPNPFYFIP